MLAGYRPIKLTFRVGLLKYNIFSTVESRYLEVHWTLWNTSIYPYLDISDLQNWGKNKLNNHISQRICNLTPAIRDILKIMWKREVCSISPFFHILLPVVRFQAPAFHAGLGGSVGYAVRLETRRSRVQPPPRSATFFRGDWSWNIFYGHSLPSADSRRAVVSFWRKNVHNTG